MTATTPRIDGPGSHRQLIRLADGRELIYFDDGPGARHEATDGRVLTASMGRPELRFDPIHEEWVVVAAHRQDRTHLPAMAECPLCPSRGDRATEIPDVAYDAAVFENRFPALAGEGRGRCEVLSYTSDHDARFSGLDTTRLRTVAGALVDRTEALSSRPDVAYVFAFENRGEEIGVTIHHPHAQIYGYPFIPSRIERALDAAERHLAATGQCLFCRIVREELEAGERVVARTDRFVAFVPRAARWPFEVHIYPTDHVPDLAALDLGQRDELMELVATSLARLEALFDSPAPYLLGWLQAPVREGRDAWHLHVEIASPQRTATKLKHLAGSETLAGAFLNDIAPEDAAAMLRGERAADREHGSDREQAT